MTPLDEKIIARAESLAITGEPTAGHYRRAAREVMGPFADAGSVGTAAYLAPWFRLDRDINLPRPRPMTLAQIAAGSGKSARKARKHLRSGKYTGAEMLDLVTGRWAVPEKKVADH